MMDQSPGLLRRLHHTSIVVDDVEASAAFLRDCFGFDVTFRAEAMTGQIQSMLGLPGISCDLVQGVTPQSDHLLEFIAFRDVPAGCDERLPVRPGQGHLAYVVSDLDAGIAAVRRCGGEPVGAVTEFAEGPAVYCFMPGGGVLELEQLVREDAA